MNRGVCEKCRARVPVAHVIENGRVYVRKSCPECGPTEGLVSSDAERWQWKRKLCRYEAPAEHGCNLHCETCHFDHSPRLVFVDVTNRCNLNCPICLANVPGMGFEFNPPLDYLERLFKEMGTWDPPPRVELFGGEPTVREDMFDIVRLARENGLPISVVTNSMRVADTDYCKQLCEENIDMLLAFDGRDPEIYTAMRGSRTSYYKKLQALDNVLKFSKRKHTVVCTLARQLNDDKMQDHFEFLHQYRSVIRRLFFIPLAEMWESNQYQTHVMTTPEDVEHILEDALGSKEIEFLPVGAFGFFEPLHRFFSKSRVRFSHVHPNCESGTLLVSDGRRYRPLSHYLKVPLADLADELIERALELNPKLEKLDPTKRFQRLRGRLLAIRAFAGPVFRSLDFRKILKGNRYWASFRILWALMRGRKLKQALSDYTNVQETVEVTILPFEEAHSLEAERMERCGAMFVYLDPDTDEIHTVPFCIWCLYRHDTMRRIADRYAAHAEA
jgi:uncharacterized radical SAM superfamily Fe-S cluster-containing enzyme